MSEKRYTEAEVAAIFERATEVQQSAGRQLNSSEGMSLAEIQEIGRQVGISPAAIVQAAQTIGGSGRLAPRKFLGFPLAVGLTVDQGRKLTDEEWDQFVVDLRETFQARGTVRSEGSLRQWTNGNLQALLEPTARGQRIRLRTVKGEARQGMQLGLFFLVLPTAGLLGAIAAGVAINPGVLTAAGALLTTGAAVFGFTAIPLPKWARTRQRQMDELAARIKLVASTTDEG